MSKYIDADKLRSEVERIKKTDCESPISVCNDILSFIDFLQEEQQEVDWADFRREAAKEILANMLSCPTTMNLGEKAIKTVGDYVSFAIGLTDELIKQLKE